MTAMSEQQSIIVPQISTFPDAEGKARQVLRWLHKRQLVATELTTCGRLGNRMAYAIGEGARQLPHAGRLPFGQPCNGLEVVTKRCIYTPTRAFLEEAGCPQCRQEIGEALFDSLEEWMPRQTDTFVCPECGFEDDINGFLFLQPCGFSNLGFIFNNWPAECFSPALLGEFAQRLGYPVRLVTVDC